MLISKTCSFNLNQTCDYFLSGIKRLWVTNTRNAEYIINNNIIYDIGNVDWYEVKISTASINATINNTTKFEELTLNFEVAYIDTEFKKILKKLRETEYSFIVLTNNQNLFFLDSMKNIQLLQQYTGNGFVIRELSTKAKTLYNVDISYLNFLSPFIPDVCQGFFDELALTSTQPKALTIPCLVEDYSGWA